MQELPAFEAAHAKFDGQVEFINVTNLATDPTAPDFVTKKGYNWLFADSEEALKKYAVTGIPLTLFIDASGNIRDKHTGSMSQADLESRISTII